MAAFPMLIAATVVCCHKGMAVTDGGDDGTGGVRSGSGGAAGCTGSGGSAAIVGDAGTGSAGCGLSGVTTGVQTGVKLTVAGRERAYVISVPASYSADTPQPLVFAFHGVGLSGSVARQYFALEGAGAGYDQPVANDRAIFVYPDALPKPSSGSQTDWDYNITGIDFAFFDALLAQVQSSYCVDMARIFATGHSAGGIFTNMLGCHRGHVLRAIAPVASMKPWSTTGGGLKCTGHVAAWIAHGANDTSSSITANGIPARDFWLAQNECSTETVPDPLTPDACVDYQGCRAGEPVVWCVHDQGHNWPSTRFGCDGGVCFDAGTAIWAFFAGLD